MAINKLFKKAVPDNVFQLLNKLMLDPVFDSFYLVGGTALALQIGHRISIDIDLFNDKSFNTGQISEHLCNSYAGKDIEVEHNTVRVTIDKLAYGSLMSAVRQLAYFAYPDFTRQMGSSFGKLHLNGVAIEKWHAMYREFIRRPIFSGIFVIG